MSVTLVPPPPRINLVDERGNITRPWQLYFEDLFTRAGRTLAPSNDELAQLIEGDSLAPAALPAAPLADDLTPPVLVVRADDAPSGRLEALEAAVFTLRQQVEALTQGTTQ